MPKKKEESIRRPAEQVYTDELKWLAKEDEHERPPNWKLSPRAVRTYILGGKTKQGKEIAPKYFGDEGLVEIAIATLATDRALMLTGLPGTAKTWLSEHLAAAVSGRSTLVVQGSAGLYEDALKYGWNYARLISHGPSEEALVESPVMRAMKEGSIVRVEELTRIPQDVSDALITVLSEKYLPIPELDRLVMARPGFNLIATANDRDAGVNELSSALMRRFNTVYMPLPETLEEEMRIVAHRLNETPQLGEIKLKKGDLRSLEQLVTAFRELRSGHSGEFNIQLQKPSGTLSTAEAISSMLNCLSLSRYFGPGEVNEKEVASVMKRAVIKDEKKDTPGWNEYMELVMKKRKGWKELYKACKKLG